MTEEKKFGTIHVMKKQLFPRQEKESLKEPMKYNERVLRTQHCPVCDMPMGDMPGTRDAVCKNCGFKDPCCE